MQMAEAEGTEVFSSCAGDATQIRHEGAEGSSVLYFSPFSYSEWEG